MFTLTTLILLALPAADKPVEADVVIRGATLYDGSGKAGLVGDLALKGDRIVAVGTFTVGICARRSSSGCNAGSPASRPKAQR